MKLLRGPTKISENEVPVISELEPMEVAEKFKAADKKVKNLQQDLNEAKKEKARWELVMLDLIEQKKLPTSFRPETGGNIHLHSQLWAAPKDGDHERLTYVLESLGLEEYLPKTVNSQSLSAYVREFCDDLGQVKVGGEDGLPPELFAVLNLTEKNSVRSTGN